MVNWTTKDPQTTALQLDIARRAKAMADAMGTHYTFLAILMDIDACHCNACPLRLADLLAADDANFAHDIFGIRAYMNRQTGKLESGFLPRYAQ